MDGRAATADDDAKTREAWFSTRLEAAAAEEAT